MKNHNLLFFLLLLHFSIIRAQNIKPFSTAIYVEDLKASVQWYEEIFNVKSYKSISYPELDSLNIELLKNKNLNFELVERNNSFDIYDLKPNYHVRESALRGFYKISFEIKRIEKFYNRLKLKNTEMHMELQYDKDLNIKSFIIKDPDNNLIQFIEKI
ncbi:VOC family protein [Aestuariibaculum sp. M13]|uniref:VOC family protein n=1 Tax=Aestuariibaculum sp. M13 TaxID=2967132 RepID=UPI002159D00F|nr:VOC family protein [Aestuariibaculum sp. M13]MCR8667689.1 VOC family protein [Aestuariibaculum sp. M13]